MNTNDGGPAFPFSELDSDGAPIRDHAGLSVLDYMAAKAMSAYILSLPPDSTMNPTVIANWSYKMAGAMLSVRASL